MKSILSLVFLLPFLTSGAEECYQGSARVAFDIVDRELIGYSANGRKQQCPTRRGFGCGAVRKYGLSVQVDDVNGTGELTEGTAWSTLDMGCTHKSICLRFANSEDVNETSPSGCRYATYSNIRYEPMNCNASYEPAYGAEYFREYTSLYFLCCSGDRCIDPTDPATQTFSSYPASTQMQVLQSTIGCTEDVELGDYLTDLHMCWNRARKGWRDYFVCNEDGMDLLDWRDTCSDSTYDEWNRRMAAENLDGDDCYFRPTCSSELETLIERFGECACSAASDNGYTGELIGSFLEGKWNRFCPNIEVTCAGPERGLYLRRKKRSKRIKFRIARAVDAWTDRLKEEFADRVRAILRADDSLYEISDPVVYIVDADTITRRRRLVDEGESEIEVVVDADNDEFNDNLSATICNDTALAQDFGDDFIYTQSCEDEDSYDDVSGFNASATTMEPMDMDTTTKEDDSSIANMVMAIFAVGISMIGAIIA